MKKGQIIAAAIGSIGLGLVVYFGFFKKNAEGKTMWQNLFPPKDGAMGSQKKDAKDVKTQKEPEPKHGSEVHNVPPEHKTPQESAPPVIKTETAVATHKKIDDYKGTWIKSPYDGLSLYYIADKTIYKTYKIGV